MKLHTKLYSQALRKAMADTKAAGQMTEDIEFVQFAPEGSRSHDYGYKIQLGTYDQRSGPTNSRHYKNSGSRGARSEYMNGENVWAATYDEWGWFIARIFAADPDARFGEYRGRDDFNRKTKNAYLLTEVRA